MAYSVKTSMMPIVESLLQPYWSEKQAGAQNRKNHHTPSVMNFPMINDHVCRYEKHFMKLIVFSSFSSISTFSTAERSLSCSIQHSSALLTCLFRVGFSYSHSQKPIHTQPRTPMIMKAISQPHARASNGIVAGAANAPTDAPLLKIEVEKARSFLGKYSAVTLMAAGKLPASPTASIRRHERKSQTLIVAMATAASLPACTMRKASILL